MWPPASCSPPSAASPASATSSAARTSAWAQLIDRVAELSGVRYPIMVLPTSIRRLARIREAIGLPGALSAEASNLMGQDWRFTSRKAAR